MVGRRRLSAGTASSECWDGRQRLRSCASRQRDLPAVFPTVCRRWERQASADATPLEPLHPGQPAAAWGGCPAAGRSLWSWLQLVAWWESPCWQEEETVGSPAVGAADERGRHDNSPSQPKLPLAVITIRLLAGTILLAELPGLKGAVRPGWQRAAHSQAAAAQCTAGHTRGGGWGAGATAVLPTHPAACPESSAAPIDMPWPST